ncbi:MAG: threonine/serine dehydratase [Bacteroidota bacterium]
MEANVVKIPEEKEIAQAAAFLADKVMHTPCIAWQTDKKQELLGQETEVWVKLELFQPGGSFKPRGALMNMQQMDTAALNKGVTAVSAGNHAIAVAVAARSMGTHAKVVMPKNANAYRVNSCQKLGAEVVLVDNVKAAFDMVEHIRDTEGRTFIHPFEGKQTILGTATVGYEFAQQAPALDAVILPIGGGGLAAGMAAAFHRLQPDCELFGVEPFGADSMFRSLAAGSPQSIEKVATIADSLGAPFALPYTFGLCQQLLAEVVRVEDAQLRRTMELMFTDMKLAAEPACAASLSALLGPLRERLVGKKVGVIACGSNIDLASFQAYLRS